MQPAAAADHGSGGREADPDAIATANARAVAHAPAAVRACITRNDDVQQVIDRAWHKQGRQQSHVTIISAVYRRLGVEPEYGGRRNDLLLKGFLGYGFDAAGHRLIMQVDPRLIDIKSFRKWVNAVAVKASKGRSPRSRLTVTVQRGCFSAKQIDRLRTQVDKDQRWDSRGNTVHLDGRLYVTFCGAANVAYAIKFQRRVGPILAIEGGCVHPA